MGFKRKFDPTHGKQCAAIYTVYTNAAEDTAA